MTAEEAEKLRDAMQQQIKDALPSEETLYAVTAERIYQVLLNIRRDLVVPPWHPLTDYLREYARAASIGRLTKETAWYRQYRFSKPLTEMVPIGECTWVDIRVHVKYKGSEGVVKYAVDRSGLIWSYQSENPIKGYKAKGKDTIGALVYFPDRGPKFKHFYKDVLYTYADELFKSNKLEGDLYMEAQDRVKLKNVAEKSDNEESAPEVQQAAQEKQEPNMKQDQTQKNAKEYFEARHKVLLTDADKELLDTVMDIVCTLYPIRTCRLREVQQKIHMALG